MPVVKVVENQRDALPTAKVVSPRAEPGWLRAATEGPQVVRTKGTNVMLSAVEALRFPSLPQAKMVPARGITPNNTEPVVAVRTDSPFSTRSSGSMIVTPGSVKLMQGQRMTYAFSPSDASPTRSVTPT